MRKFSNISSGRRRRTGGLRQLPTSSPPQTHPVMNQINVVPYIDVMLVLLVIFHGHRPLINTSMIELPSVGRSNQPAGGGRFEW